MNLNPLIWISKKYLEDIIIKKINPISNLASKLEKDNIGLNHQIENHKERIIKLEDRLREYEIKIASFNSAVDVLRYLNTNKQNNIILVENE